MQDRSKPETRNPKPETNSEDLTSPGLIETRNPKPTAKVGFNRRNPKPETRSPKPETRNRQRKLVSSDETRNPKPTAKVGFNRRNPKPETRNRLESDFWVALRIGTRYRYCNRIL